MARKGEVQLLIQQIQKTFHFLIVLKNFLVSVFNSALHAMRNYHLKIKSHLFSGNKHKTSKNNLARKEARERDIASYLTQYNREEHPAGMSVSMEEHVY